jgi:hypothetical protein
MEKSVNIIIYELKQEINKILTKDGLPASITSLVINEIAAQVNNQTNQLTAQEIKLYNEELDKEDQK